MRSRQETMNIVERRVRDNPDVPGIVEACWLAAIADVLFDLREQNERIIEILTYPSSRG